MQEVGVCDRRRPLTIAGGLESSNATVSTKLSAARRFLRDTAFSSQRAHAEFPNARRILEGGLFVSHSGLDTNRSASNCSHQ